MTNREFGSWLESALVQARDAGWCTSPYCTTCGAMKFRRAYWSAAARQAGVEGRFESARLPRDLLAGVPDTDRDALVHALVAGLRELRPPATDGNAFRTIILDLDPPFVKHGVAMSLDSSLSGTAAGAALGRMRDHSKALQAGRAQRLAYESPQAVEARQRAKREKRTAAQAQRRSEKQRRDVLRLELLETLTRLSPAERLLRFASDPDLVLDSVPVEFIELREINLADLPKTQTIALISRIDRRRGAWGRLRRRLENRLEGRCPVSSTTRYTALGEEDSQ